MNNVGKSLRRQFSRGLRWNYLGLLLGVATGALGASEPPFAGYVRAAGDFVWKMHSQPGWNQYQIELTSQNWHGAIWTHTVNVVTPTNAVAADLCVIQVNGGGDLGQLAEATGVACASVGGIVHD